MHGVWLLLAHPEVAGRSCADCRQWMYDDGERLTARKLIDSEGKPLPRPPGRPGEVTTPCDRCPKIPTGQEPRPEIGEQSELSPRNQQAYLHYVRCKAVGRFPRDRLIEWHAGLIRLLEDEVAREREVAQVGVLELLPALAMAGLKR